MKKLISLDTETTTRLDVPFIATMHDGSESILLDMHDSRDIQYLKKVINDSTLIFHQASFDIYALLNHNINIKQPYHDTMILANLINENYKSRRLKDLAKVFLNEQCLEEKALNKVKSKFKRIAKKDGKVFDYAMIPTETIEPYAVKDAEYTYDLFNHFMSMEPDMINSRLYKLETLLVPIIVKMQKHGVYIDRKFCESERKRLIKIRDDSYEKFISVAGKINPRSPKQLGKFIESLDIPIRGNLLTKKGRISTDKDAMKILKDKSPAFKYIEAYRSTDKMITTYYNSLLDDYTTHEDPVAHFLFYQSGTKTGRFSADLIQTIPKEKEDDPYGAMRVRKAFVCRPGYVNFYFDYDQIEMRLFAHFSKNQKLIDAINRGEDPHTATACFLFDAKNPTKFQRDIAKKINFGIIYGMGLELLLETLSKYGLERRECQEILNKYHKLYRVRDYIYAVTRELFRQGFISVDWIGRKYRIPKELAYKGANAVIQGSAAYIIKLAMLQVDELLKKKYPDVNMLVTVHDELIPEMPISKKSRYSEFITDMTTAMETKNLFAVPITVDTAFSETNWYEKKKWRE